MKIFGKRREHLVTETLSEYLSGSLPPGEGRHVEAHVETCAGCRDELDSLRYTVGLMRRVPMVAPRTTFTLSEAPVAASSRARVSWLPGWSYGAAASVAVMVFAIVLSADVAGLLSEDVAAPAPVSRTSADDVAAFALEAPAAAPAPESATEGADLQNAAVEAEVAAAPAAPLPVEDQATEGIAAPATAAPQATSAPAGAPALEKASEAAAVEAPAVAAAAPPAVDEPASEAGPLPSPTPAAVAQAAEAAEPEAVDAPALAAAPPSPVEEPVAEPATASAVEEGQPLPASDGSEEPAEGEVPSVAVTEDEAIVTTPSESGEPDTQVAAPVMEPAPSPEATPLDGTTETTSVLWRVLEGIAGGLAVVIIGTFLWSRRRQTRLSA